MVSNPTITTFLILDSLHNMKTTIYHCSPDEILEFDFSHGVHFGGFFSALEAGYRKLNNLRMKYNCEQEIVYMHTCILNECKVYVCDDVGGFDAWNIEIERANKLGFDVIKYNNKYEPDTQPSYLVLNKNLIQLIKIETITEKSVIDKLESCWQTGNLEY